MTTKKIKVEISDKVASYTTGGKRYRPGDIVEVDSASFVADFMEKVEEPKPPKEEKPVPTEEPTPAESPISTATEKEESVVATSTSEKKPTRRKKEEK